MDQVASLTPDSASAPPPADDAFQGLLVPRDRAEWLLRLNREDTRLAEATFGRLPLAEQTEMVLSVPPDQRLDLLLLPEDATALVQALPEMELHRTVQTVGKWEAMELVAVASEGQINFMLDHDCWRGERLDSRKFTDWLQLFLECDDQQVFRILTAINADLLALALKKHVRFEKDFMIEDAYYLDPDWVKGSNPTVQQFIERLYSLDPNLWIRLMGWVRLHSKETIEADAIEGRDGRLRGKGYPAPSLAITVYYPVDFDVRRLLDGWLQEHAVRPAAWAELPVERARESLFFRRVLDKLAVGDGGGADHAARWEAELVDVANKVMVADQVDLGDMRRQREAVDKVRRWISIGLEAAAEARVEVGAVLIKAQTLEYFFRLAAMLFDALGSAVVELEKAEQASSGILISGDFSAAYLALTEPEPQIPEHTRFSSRRHLFTLAEYRFAWQLVWSMDHYLRQQTRQAPSVATVPPVTELPAEAAVAGR